MLTKLRGVLLFSLLFTYPITAEAFKNAAMTERKEGNQQGWLVQPKACIVEALGDECELSFDIILPTLEKGVYCYFANNENLQCFNSKNPVSVIEISFSENTLLSLRLMPSTNNTILAIDTNNLPPPLFTQMLEIRTRTSKKQVRRVRDPWSLF
jgi:hypothetical protein